jgi:hypothetical protein
MSCLDEPLHAARGCRRLVPEKKCMRYAIAVLVAAAVLAGCHRGTQYNADEVNRLKQSTNAPHASPVAYSAVSYDKPGHPKLGAADVAKIRAVLAATPMQHKLQLMYAFPATGLQLLTGGSHVVLFFEDEGPGAPTVQGEKGLHYDELDGEVYSGDSP